MIKLTPSSALAGLDNADGNEETVASPPPTAAEPAQATTKDGDHAAA